MTIGRKFGQHEPLTTRLHNLVRSYPKGLGVLKEFIQNADDAEADEIVFVVDEHPYDVSGLPATMRWLHKTPALLVYNNKPFSDGDIAGIQRIGESGKSDSVGKTGRFGLGFNACYNVTDVPSFFTRGELHFFDPHFQTVPDASVESPGRCFGGDELIGEGWPLLDGFSQFIGDGDRFEGTVFRLPFRTTEQASTSRIKSDAYTVADALDAVRELQEMGSAMLLFLKHVRRLKIERRIEDGPPVTLLSMEASNVKEIAKSRSKVNNLLSSPNLEHILTDLIDEGAVCSSCLHEYHVEVGGEQHTERWRVVDGFFTDAEHSVIEACRKMVENEEKALPYAGAAWSLDSGRQPEGRIFCFLPVPMQTGMPAQINGYFDLDDSRQNMFLDRSAHGTARLRVDWNKTLLRTSVAQAYVRLLEDLRTDLGTSRIESYYGAFPEAVANETSWEGWITSAIYKHASVAALFRCSGDNIWSALSATRSLPEDLLPVGDALIEEGLLPIPTPALPLHVKDGFTLNEINIPMLTPCDLRIRLLEQRDIDCPVAAAPRTCLRKRENVTEILRFCLSDDPEDGIRGLPLVIDCRGHLRTLGLTDAPLYIAGMSLDLDVFWDHPEWFVDPLFERELELPLSNKTLLFDMDSKCFVRELAEYVSAKVEGGEPRLNRARAGTLTDAWLREVFKRLLESNLDGLGPDLNTIPLIPDQTRILHPMGSCSTPLLFRGSQELKRALIDLGVPLVSGVSEELLSLLGKFSDKQDCIWPVTPRDLIDTLSDQCSETLQEYEELTDVQRALLGYLSRDESMAALEKMADQRSKLNSLKLFPTAKGDLVNLSETAYVSQDFTFPRVDFDVVLLDDGPSHRWRRLYLLLGAPELSRARLIREVLLPGFGDLDEDARIEASAWLRDNLSAAQSEGADGDSDGLFEEVRSTSIIICKDGTLRAPASVYRPESMLASAVLGDQAAFPDMAATYAHGHERWLEFFRQLDMPVEPRLGDVVEYVRTLMANISNGDKVQRLQAVYEFVKNRVDAEIQNQTAVSQDLADALGKLADITWIPLRQEAGDFLCFLPPESVNARPSEVYFPRVGQLVASQASITVLRPEPDKPTRKAMGFPVRTRVDLVVTHFQEVLGACSAPETMPKENVLVRALGQIYRFFGGEAPREADELDDNMEDIDAEDTVNLEAIFSDIPCIWDQERKCFWRPEHVFADNVRYMEPWRRTIRSSEQSIERGYTALGRKAEPTVEDWKQVLVEVSASNKSPTQYEVAGVVREVIRHIVEQLGNADEVDGEVFVPTRDDRMLKAETVFLADAPWYESMLDSWNIPILSPSVSGIRGIQHVLAIPSLAASIEQRLTEYPSESDLENECRECARLESLLRSSELILGLQRLLRHEGHEVSVESLSYLGDVHVRCVKSIRTCLYLLTNEIERFLGDAEADFHWDHETLQAMLAEKRRRYFCDDLAELLNRTLGEKSLQNLAPLVHVLRCKPPEISEVMDDLKIRQYAFECERRLEAEDKVTPQMFPSEADDRKEQREISESEETEHHAPDNDESEEEILKVESSPNPDDSADSGQGDPPGDGSTATRPRRDKTDQPSQRRGGPENGQRSDVPSGTSTAGSGKTGTRSDIERGEPLSGGDGFPGKSTVSRYQPTVQRRLVSYVSHGVHDSDSENGPAGSDSRRLLVGDTAVKIVIEHEQKKGRKARPMAHSNKGYDVISEGEANTRYIEVKGIEAAWGERGVAMTAPQFFYARENPERDHWLYVVEDVFSQAPRIHEIQNPSEKADRFVFDGGWKQAAVSTQGTSVKISIPVPGDEVLVNGQVIGRVESTLKSGRFPLVIYRDPAGNQHRKLLADLIIRAKET